jgi:uncharacterized protein (UPF0264 family)
MIIREGGLVFLSPGNSTVAQLLVSVRSVEEARHAINAGASIIDVKEPDRGSLGRASEEVWRAVRDAVPSHVPVSVALGELSEWVGAHSPEIDPRSWKGLSYRKIGLTGRPLTWRDDWRQVRERLDHPDAPPWVAVVYADWKQAPAPTPDEILTEAIATPNVQGILIDTYLKDQPFEPDRSWIAWARRAHDANRFVAIAGGLDLDSIPLVAHLSPTIIGVRGAVCLTGRRTEALDPLRVSKLVDVVSRI